MDMTACPTMAQLCHIIATFLSITMGSYALEDNYQKVPSNQNFFSGIQILDTLPGCTKLRCAGECGRWSGCVGIAYSAVDCLLLDGQPLGTKPFVYSNTYDLYFKRNVELTILAYRVSPGLNTDATILYQSTQSSPPSGVTAAMDLSTPLSVAYKNPILDNWTAFTISKVAVAFVTSGGALLNVTIDSTSATHKNNWMTKSKILSSPWTDLTSASTTNYFEINGPQRRRFYMSNFHNGCGGDRGWFQVSAQPESCQWLNGRTNLPAILYSPGSTGVIWGSYAQNAAVGKDMLLLLTVSPTT